MRTVENTAFSRATQAFTDLQTMDYIVDRRPYDGSGTIIPTDDMRRHLAALRLRRNEHIGVLNGSGTLYLCRYGSEAPSIHLTVVEVQRHEPPCPLTIIIPVLHHRDRFEFALEKVVELGATEIVVWQADHSEFQRSSTSRMLAKIEAASAQCGRLWFPEVRETSDLTAILTSYPDADIVVGDAGGHQHRELLSHHVVVLAGPEGGLSEREQAALANHPRLHRWKVGEYRLRAETAVVGLTALVITGRS